MPKAKYHVPFEDFDYAEMATACGLTSSRTEPDKKDGGLWLYVEGSEMAIASFSADLSWGPESVEP